VTDEEARIEASTKAMKVLKDWFPIKIPDRVIKGEFSKWESENVQQTSVVTCSFSDSHSFLIYGQANSLQYHNTNL